MKNNARRLYYFSLSFPLDMFFSITVDRYDVCFLAHFNPKSVLLFRNRKFKVDTDQNGFLALSRGHFRVIFTD